MRTYMSSPREEPECRDSLLEQGVNDLWGTLSNDSLKKQTFLRTLFFCTFKVDVFLKRITLSSLPYGKMQRERKLCC